MKDQIAFLGTMASLGSNLYGEIELVEVDRSDPQTKVSPKKVRGKIEPVRTEPKIRRNDPCPCGSGKKAKKCCGTN